MGSQNWTFSTSSCNLAEDVEGLVAYFVDDRNNVCACVKFWGEQGIYTEELGLLTEQML